MHFFIFPSCEPLTAFTWLDHITCHLWYLSVDGDTMATSLGGKMAWLFTIQLKREFKTQLSVIFYKMISRNREWVTSFYELYAPNGFLIRKWVKDQKQGPKWVSVIIVADTSPVGTIAKEKQIQYAWFQVGSDINTYSLDALLKFAQSYLFNFF